MNWLSGHVLKEQSWGKINIPYVLHITLSGLGLSFFTFITSMGSFRANGYNKTGVVFIVSEIFYVSIIRC